MSDFTNFVYRTNGVSCYQHDDYIPQDATFKVNCTGAPVGNQIRIQLANMSTQLVLCDFRVYGECKDRTWGKACNECGFCKDFSQCDATNGSCLSGCEPGYIPPLCSKANTYQTGCDCTDGYYCENTYEYPTICPTGHFCVNGLKSPCSAGTFTSNSGSAQCEQCTPGYYCPNLGLSTVTDVCWIGHYCPEGAVVPSPCPNGYYQTDTGKSDCIICPVNFYCNQTEAEVEKQSGTSKPTHGVVTPKECQPKRCLKPGLSGELDPFEIGGLSISISCKPSCRQHMTPFTDLKFMANCDGCENEVSSYQWSIRECFSEVIQECEHYVNSVTFLTESTGYYTAIPHNDKQNWTYIAVVVKVTLNDGREGMASHIWQYLEGVQVDCQTSPVSGVAGETRFTVICIEPALPVDKDNIRCSMSYAYSITGDSLIYQTNETCNHTGIILRQGDKTKDYRQHLKVVGMYIDHLIWDVPILLQVVLPSVTTDLLENAVDELSGNLTGITTTEEAFGKL
ncbi:uncharacterized protein LOC123532096 [Mercenaria mercenaria]|uniref:uncharacterized protein LOC123532096 n=1 Tax=Mercenaria mercenaria TaxID=6596 RepID=UPI00234FA6F9|nr:uncharacterized protein LOC123532096 [Mercenaria mercenaria]